MTTIKTTINNIEATCDPNIVKYKNKLYVIFSQDKDKLKLILKEEYDTDINKTLDLIFKTEEFINEIRKDTK